MNHLQARQPGSSIREPAAVASRNVYTTPSGELLFSVHVRLNIIDDSGRAWVPIEIEAFIPGEWVRDMLEFSVRLSAEEGDPSEAPKERNIDELRKKFGLS